MEQSIVRSQTGVNPAEAPDKGWGTIVTVIRSALAGARRKIISSFWFFRKPLNSDIASTLAVDRIAARLSVEDRARSDGRIERPATTEEVLDGTQREIVHYFRQMQRRAREQVAELGRKLRRASEGIDVSEAVSYLRDIPSRCQNEVLRITVDFQPQLDFLCEREVRQRRHYEAFREENRLSRIATYPDLPILYYAFMVALTAVTAIALVNSPAILADGSISIPASWALPISSLVVIIPFVIGAGIFRSVNHIRSFRRVMAWLAGFMTVVLIGSVAFVCAHYFASLPADPETSVRGVIDAIVANPTAVGTNVTAWKAFGIVSLAGLLAFFIGYRSDDPYPGYGAVQKSYYRARMAREKRTRQLRERINTVIDVAEIEVAEATKRLKSHISRIAALIDEFKRMQMQLGDFNVALEDGCNMVLDRYRTVNESVRRTGAPMSFSEHVCFRSEEDPAFDELRHGKDRLNELNRGMAEFEAEVVLVRQKLRDLNGRAINDLDAELWQEAAPPEAGEVRSA